MKNTKTNKPATTNKPAKVNKPARDNKAHAPEVPAPVKSEDDILKENEELANKAYAIIARTNKASAFEEARRVLKIEITDNTMYSAVRREVLAFIEKYSTDAKSAKTEKRAPVTRKKSDNTARLAFIAAVIADHEARGCNTHVTHNNGRIALKNSDGHTFLTIFAQNKSYNIATTIERADAINADYSYLSYGSQCAFIKGNAYDGTHEILRALIDKEFTTGNIDVK